MKEEKGSGARKPIEGGRDTGTKCCMDTGGGRNFIQGGGGGGGGGGVGGWEGIRRVVIVVVYALLPKIAHKYALTGFHCHLGSECKPGGGRRREAGGR